VKNASLEREGLRVRPATSLFANPTSILCTFFRQATNLDRRSRGSDRRRKRSLATDFSESSSACPTPKTRSLLRSKAEGPRFSAHSLQDRFDAVSLSPVDERPEEVMPRGDKSAYTDKQKRQAEHIEEGYKSRGVKEDVAEARAWATVNATTGGGKKSGSGRGKAINKAPARKGGRIGGAAAAARPAAARKASARKAARTRARNQST
jgi:hypothetical protein